MNVKEKKIHLDKIDTKIISILKSDARASLSNISQKVKLSLPATSDRIKKLEDMMVITGYKAIINPSNLGLDISAFITIISDSSANYEKIVKRANETSEIVECFATTGRGSHILLVQTENSNSLEQLLRNIQSWPNVIRTETQIILSINKNLKSNK